MQPLELLSPAGNGEIGKAAINYGADAVYIGAPRFSARKAAGNDLKEIESLIQYAHQYHAKVYIAINTILKDTELDEAYTIIKAVYEAGADALIIQDMGFLEMNLPPIPLFASTQTNNVTKEKVLFLEKVGFQRVILARELTTSEILEIRNHTQIALESFVHGALCVSYSGQCYMSQYLCGRSANRGECAQPCRMQYSLIDKNEKVIVKDKYLLSLKDLSLCGQLQSLIDAGVSSFKIEGRLKDIHYVKNITASYRKELDLIIGKNNFRKASSGSTKLLFTPDTEKSFNRGFTNYFIEGRKDKIYSPDTQKSTGKKIGTVKEVNKDFFTADLYETIVNGDGLCFFNNDGTLEGIRINKVEENKLYPLGIFTLKKGQTLYRNNDKAFEQLIEIDKSKRKIDIHLLVKEISTGIEILLTDEDGICSSKSILFEKQIAQKAEESKQNIIKTLAKTGDTIFEAVKIELLFEAGLFIPNSLLSATRRDLLESHRQKRLAEYKPESVEIQKNDYPFPEKDIDYSTNVFNKRAESFYYRHGVNSIQLAMEANASKSYDKLMTTRHCILYELDHCKKISKEKISEPLFLIDKTGKRFRLEFNCADCLMIVKPL